MNCGKQPRDSRGRHIIWHGWAGNYCRDCAKEIDKENYKSWKLIKKSKV